MGVVGLGMEEVADEPCTRLEALDDIEGELKELLDDDGCEDWIGG